MCTSLNNKVIERELTSLTLAYIPRETAVTRAAGAARTLRGACLSAPARARASISR